MKQLDPSASFGFTTEAELHFELKQHSKQNQLDPAAAFGFITQAELHFELKQHASAQLDPAAAAASHPYSAAAAAAADVQLGILPTWTQGRPLFNFGKKSFVHFQGSVWPLHNTL